MTGDSNRYIAVHTFESHDLERSIPLVVEVMKETEQKTKITVQDHQKQIHRKSRLSVLPSETGTVQTNYCQPGVFFKNMSLLLDDNAILCSDIGDNALWLASGVRSVKGQRTITSEHMGIMGFALNAGKSLICKILNDHCI